MVRQVHISLKIMDVVCVLLPAQSSETSICDGICAHGMGTLQFCKSIINSERYIRVFRAKYVAILMMSFSGNFVEHGADIKFRMSVNLQKTKNKKTQ